MSTQNICYLLGAGASANALPTIKKVTDVSEKIGLSDELKKFVADNFNHFTFSGYNKFGKSDYLVQIADSCVDFGTPDLYAKFLLETNDSTTYELLIRLMANYFIYKENEKFLRDSRALTFLTMVAENCRIPESLRIVSWNYDNQIELAASDIRMRKYGDPLTNFYAWPNDTIIGENSYKLVHINGVSGYKYSTNSMSEVNKNWRHFDDSINPLISFAWENKEHGKYEFQKNKIEQAKKAFKGCSILVIIGYSFPFFNRKIDNELMEVLRPTLRKIYFQDPYNTGSFLYERFSWLDEGINLETGIIQDRFKINIKHIPNCEQYFIPVEL